MGCTLSHCMLCELYSVPLHAVWAVLGPTACCVGCTRSHCMLCGLYSVPLHAVWAVLGPTACCVGCTQSHCVLCDVLDTHRGAVHVGGAVPGPLHSTEIELPCLSGKRRLCLYITFEDSACPAELPWWLSW